MPRTQDKSNFDVDLDFGEVSEQAIVDMFENEGKIEIKTERDIWLTTGNIAFEIKGYKGRKSGLSTTEAKWWIQVLTFKDKTLMMLTFKVDILKKVLKKMHKEHKVKIVKGGDNNYSTMILAPITKLIKEYYEIYR
tara:strand:+ start:107 stop:514 length:408 start_codon:yes stop_codon:yes gene_type:complete